MGRSLKGIRGNGLGVGRGKRMGVVMAGASPMSSEASREVVTGIGGSVNRGGRSGMPGIHFVCVS